MHVGEMSTESHTSGNHTHLNITSTLQIQRVDVCVDHIRPNLNHSDVVCICARLHPTLDCQTSGTAQYVCWKFHITPRGLNQLRSPVRNIRTIHQRRVQSADRIPRRAVVKRVAMEEIRAHECRRRCSWSNSGCSTRTQRERGHRGGTWSR